MKINSRKFKEKAYVTPEMMGISKPIPAPDPRPKQMMQFCLGEKNNKLLSREAKNTDFLDLYTTKVNHSNYRVNVDMQSKRAVGYPYKGQLSPTNNGPSGSSNLLMQKHGRDNLIRIPFMWN